MAISQRKKGPRRQTHALSPLQPPTLPKLPHQEAFALPNIVSRRWSSHHRQPESCGHLYPPHAEREMHGERSAAAAAGSDHAASASIYELVRHRRRSASRANGRCLSPNSPALDSPAPKEAVAFAECKSGDRSSPPNHPPASTLRRSAKPLRDFAPKRHHGPASVSKSPSDPRPDIEIGPSPRAADSQLAPNKPHIFPREPSTPPHTADIPDTAPPAVEPSTSRKSRENPPSAPHRKTRNKAAPAARQRCPKSRPKFEPRCTKSSRYFHLRRRGFASTIPLAARP